MASLTINVKAGIVLERLNLSGERCRSCDDQIFGTGFNLILTTNVNSELLPSFHDKKIYICNSCQEAVKESLGGN